MNTEVEVQDWTTSGKKYKSGPNKQDPGHNMRRNFFSPHSISKDED